MKYKGRKKYSSEEAGVQMENIMQHLLTNQECINYWKNTGRDRCDILIEALTNKTRDEMIKDNEEQNQYLLSKYRYMKQFNPNYRLKGSFGIPTFKN